jgi:ADP-ribosyl-[dinitrogen reductase] hydrolase
VPDGAESLARIVPLAMRHWADAEALQAAVRATTGVTCHEPATFDAAARCAAALLAALRGAPPGDIMDAVADASAVPAALPTAAAAASPTAVLTAAARAFAGGAGWKDAVLRAVNLGGPADALGALTGALAGAHFGIEAIPAAWRGAIAQREEIEELADRLLADALVGLAA